MCQNEMSSINHFLKPFLKGTILQSGEGERRPGVNSILITMPFCVFDRLPEKIEPFVCLLLLRLVERII